MRSPLLALTLTTLLAVIFAPPAQAQGRVSIEELTVDGDPPPDEYRTMLANAIRPSLVQIRDAYGRRLAERPALGGDYRLRLWVSNREVVRITPESTIGDETLERQTRESIYQFHLPPEAPTGGAWVRFVVRFAAPAGAVATPAPTVPSPAPVTGSGAGSGTGGTGATAPPLVSPGLPVPSLRVPTVHIDSIRGALADSALLGTLPVPALSACMSSASGTVPVAISVNRRGRIAASPGRGTLRDRTVARCIETAIESLTLSPEAGPTRARITITIPPP